MHVVLSLEDGGTQAFNIWVCGEREKLARGSGLFVGETGVEANHHFLCAPGEEMFRFSAGRYGSDVFVRVVGDKEQKALFSDELDGTSEAVIEMSDSGAGLYFDWAPDASRYVRHIERNRSRPLPWDIQTFAHHPPA